MKYLIPIFIIVFIGFPLIVGAEDIEDFTDCDDIENQGYTNTANLCRTLKDIETILYIIAIGLAFIVIIISGIVYMTAGADENRITKARKTLIYGVIGIAIVIGSTLIISLISEIILKRFNP